MAIADNAARLVATRLDLVKALREIAFMRRIFLVALSPFALSLSGCIARTAADIVTAPVKVASKTADLATTSQSEADEKRGREIRKREEKLGKLGRRYEAQRAECDRGDADACTAARETRAEMDALSPTLPVEPD